jgi:hypothetical protein
MNENKKIMNLRSLDYSDKMWKRLHAKRPVLNWDKIAEKVQKPAGRLGWLCRTILWIES